MEMQSYRKTYRISMRLIGLVLHGVAVILSGSAKAADWVANRCTSKSCIHLDQSSMQSFWGAMPVVIKVQEQKELRADQLRPRNVCGDRSNWGE